MQGPDGRKLTDQEILEHLQELRAMGAKPIGLTTTAGMEPELGTFEFFIPNRTQRRAMRRTAGPMPSTAKGAAARRKNRRRTARRSAARNRA